MHQIVNRTAIFHWNSIINEGDQRWKIFGTSRQIGKARVIT